MKQTFSAETLKSYALTFRAIDRENRGFIDVDQLMEALYLTGVKSDRKTVIGIIQLLEEGTENTMDLGEFVHFMHVCANARTDDVLSVIFYSADFDYTGTINKKKLRKIVSKLGIKMSEEEICEMYQSTADNKDGTISQSMFKALMAELMQ
ncbi:EF_hand domain-containing protein [Hexamita inflata]|uniref:EF hand domain-containing protein n=1 Tax=Hexamita inflata TaxID=28002 RepID=A0AA86QAX9_9EUKA|nr:EF hand domain-containing protein [Hexamita inflata]CAI9954984.1 EF hand domain-containing protein [Hexamita inflata]CAI9955784.1 EF hand domain-containing protein [Hexamita inflata]